MPTILATDLDRTLFPNGNHPYDNSMPLFRAAVKKRKLPLVFVTGRHLEEINAGLRDYEPPRPDYAIAEVGTRLYRREGDRFVEDEDYVTRIEEQTRGWNLDAFKKTLEKLPLRLQPKEHQNRFKLSFFVDHLDRAEPIRRETRDRIGDICPDAQLIWSVDETRNLGLLDILPSKADKTEGIEYLRKQLETAVEDIVYCGDSGNDILPLTYGYRAILVANAIDEVREEVRRRAGEKGISDRIYHASGLPGIPLNGNYVSGIIEGLVHFGILDERELRTLV